MNVKMFYLHTNVYIYILLSIVLNNFNTLKRMLTVRIQVKDKLVYQKESNKCTIVAY